MEERKVYVNGDDDNILKETVMAHLLEAILLTKKICPVEDAKACVYQAYLLFF
ncbi:hypothetical protein DESAMIL20_638 [Desulfurella amilsii]|uniref:Uncharacterized protein n=1 Tax=Desulfurella amilsii TaxID=1562698 RepID=A0A1X4XYD0_9BACT|nr:hypothetical protein [Desulfurella amilsii]OSS42523.1 hypothetical protein DESAMIL20_638 [Desulfurella amilsii]